MKRKLVGDDEYDAFSRWRRVYSWRPGDLRKLKRRSSKRERRARIEDGFCCVCACGHECVRDPSVRECPMCRWCMCTAHPTVDKVPQAE